MFLSKYPVVPPSGVTHVANQIPNGVSAMSANPHSWPPVANPSPTMPHVTDDTTRTMAANLRRKSRRVRALRTLKGPGRGFEPRTREPQSHMLTRLHYPGHFWQPNHGFWPILGLWRPLFALGCKRPQTGARLRPMPRSSLCFNPSRPECDAPDTCSFETLRRTCK